VEQHQWCYSEQRQNTGGVVVGQQHGYGGMKQAQ